MPKDALKIEPRKFKLIPIEKITSPSNGIFRVICDAWWLVTPEKELLFYGFVYKWV